MAAQAALIADTIAGMKRVLHRHDSSNSESEDSPPKPTNRGNKLKRKAKYMHAGHLSGQKSYKRKIEYAGYQRYIISTNPKRYDEYGDELEDDEVDEEADADAADRNPYSEIKLEELLMPLTAAAELPNHPSLSIPYKSDVLPGMVQQACEMAHKERKTLWDIKHLLTKLRGCATWIPCDTFLSDGDAKLFGDPAHVTTQTLNNGVTQGLLGETSGCHVHSVSNGYDTTLNGDNSDHLNGNIDPAANASADANRKSTPSMPSGPEEVDKEPQPIAEDPSGGGPKPTSENRSPTPMNIINAVSRANQDMQQPSDIDQRLSKVEEGAPTDDTATIESLPPAEDEEMEDVQAPPTRMRTRAQAQAASDDKTPSARTRSPSHDSSTPPYIHPLFIIPPSAVPDRDIGLPHVEAEETRRVLAMFVQKQEEVVRGAERLYEGLLKGDRMRKTVFAWCKAEGHVGEMSDGEDWYDQEAWGLDEALKKGQMDEEDEGADKGKKTRGRRGAQ